MLFKNIRSDEIPNSLNIQYQSKAAYFLQKVERSPFYMDYVQETLLNNTAPQVDIKPKGLCSSKSSPNFVPEAPLMFHSEILASLNFIKNKFLSPVLENNHTLKCCSGNFPT